MKKWTSEMLAVSMAGHDRGELFVVLDKIPPKDGEDAVYYLLADGRRRTLEHPKKKKQKHLQLIRHLPGELLAQMQDIYLDAHVRKILKSYREMQNLSEK